MSAAGAVSDRADSPNRAAVLLSDIADDTGDILDQFEPLRRTTAFVGMPPLPN
jgi:hypothetical protein